MHELSIALAILDIASEAAGELGGAKVIAVHLKLGPLSGVVREALVSAYEIAEHGTQLEGSRLVIEEVPVLARCDACGGERPVASIQRMVCAECGAPAHEITSGGELEITALEVET